MPAYSKATLSFESAADYLSQINPLAQRIAKDIQETKLTYGQLWRTLELNEQNDIINETLIKPELTLRYFDSFSSSSSSSSSTNMLCKEKTTTNAATQRHLSKKKPTFACMKNYYAFDGRNLRTFALQKVALKCIQDDTGLYRDEFSAPFSCRTKSQINLQLFSIETAMELIKSNGNANDGEAEIICLLNATNQIEKDRKQMFSKNIYSIENKNELETNVYNKIKLKQNYERLANDAKGTVSDAAVQKITSIATHAKNAKTAVKILDDKEYDKNLLLSSYIAASTTAAATSPAMAHAIYTGGKSGVAEESANLMENCCSGSGSVLTAYSSSADDYDDDEKTFCEDVKLLNNDVNEISLRKGFDFLNNW